MSPDGAFAVLALIVLFAFTVEAAAGFGSTVLALALGVHLYPIPRLLPLIVPLNLVLELYLVTRHGTHVDQWLLWRQIVPLMGAGVAAGFALFSVASTQVLQTVFGVFVVGVAVHGLTSALFARTSSLRPLSPPAIGSGLLAAGVTHGLFATGGPLLVYVLSRTPLDKREFRSTLAAVWLIFNIQAERKGALKQEMVGMQQNRAIEGKGMVAAVLFDYTEEANQSVLKCAEAGILVVHTGKNSVKLGPPLTITDEHLEKGLEIIAKIVSQT